MDETRADGDDDDEGGNSEDEDGEYEDGSGDGGGGTVSHSNRRQARSFYFTTSAVKRIESKEDGSLTVMCQVGGHVQCSNIIPMPNGGTHGVSQHFLKFHIDLNVKIRTLEVLPGADKNTPDLMTLLHMVVLSSPGLVLETRGVSFLCHQPMNPSRQHTSVLWRTWRTGGSQT